MESVNQKRYYIVIFPPDKTAEKMISLFSTYENAMKFCEQAKINISQILGIPLDSGYASIETSEVFLF